MTRYLADDSQRWSEAEQAILPFMPNHPRSAKRLVNHLRLWLVIAAGRRLFGGKPPLRPCHLALWLVLTERWPRLAAALATEANVLQELADALPEFAAGTANAAIIMPMAVEKLQQALDARGIGIADTQNCTRATPELVALLRAEPTMPQVLARLIGVEPAVAASLAAAASGVTAGSGMG
jgi:hypothetical protein